MELSTIGRRASRRWMVGHGDLVRIDALEERYAIEAVSSPSGVTHLTLTKKE